MAQQRNNGHAVKIDELAPHSVEAEMATLGGLLMDADALTAVRAFLQPADFFIVRHQWVYEAMLAVADRDDMVDSVTVGDELRARGQLDDLGGMAYLTRLINHTPTSLYVETYAQLVQRAAIRRGLLEAASRIATLAHDNESDIDAILEHANTALVSVRSRRQPPKDDSARGIAERMFDEVEAALLAGGRVGLQTGYADFDRMTGGLHKDDLIVLAARPGMGKTSLALNIALTVARAGGRVGLFSLEMSDTQNMQRLVALETKLSVQKMRTGQMTDAEFALFTEAFGRMSDLPLRIDDQGQLTFEQLSARAQRWHNTDGLDLLIVDYLQLMKTPERDNRTREIGAISNGLKRLARELRIPVLACAQLNRGVESRQDKRPVLSDLRDSGEIEQDADIVAFLYRDEVYNDNPERINQADVIIAKHRNGPTGIVTLFFRADVMQFSNLRRTDVNLKGF